VSWGEALFWVVPLVIGRVVGWRLLSFEQGLGRVLLGVVAASSVGSIRLVQGFLAWPQCG
jgi:hypothetical protein